jgi:hypothetical protein
VIRASLLHTCQDAKESPTRHVHRRRKGPRPSSHTKETTPTRSPSSYLHHKNHCPPPTTSTSSPTLLWRRLRPLAAGPRTRRAAPRAPSRGLTPGARPPPCGKGPRRWRRRRRTAARQWTGPGCGTSMRCLNRNKVSTLSEKRERPKKCFHSFAFIRRCCLSSVLCVYMSCVCVCVSVCVCVCVCVCV